jgi:hypothetical protein
MGRICIDCCALEYLSTFHHCTFFTRLSILKNGFKTSFFEYKTAVRFESRSAAAKRSGKVLTAGNEKKIVFLLRCQI